jgi:hypothetical protein
MSICTLLGGEQLTDQEMQMSDETISLNWDHEHARFERELLGLTRALGWKALKRLRRPKAAWDDMVDDMQIFAWRAWRSLRLRGLEPQAIGIFAIADRAVRTSLQGAVFRPIGTMGDRSWADSIHNRKKNKVEVRSNKEDWQLEGATGDGQEESDVMADWLAWKSILGDDERALIEALEAGDTAALKDVKNPKRRKRALADRFKEFRNR